MWEGRGVWHFLAGARLTVPIGRQSRMLHCSHAWVPLSQAGFLKHVMFRNIYVRICCSSYKNRKPPAPSAHILLRLHRIKKKNLGKKSMGINQYHLYPSILERLGSSNISSRCFPLSRTEKLLSHICKILISQTQGKE